MNVAGCSPVRGRDHPRLARAQHRRRSRDAIRNRARGIIPFDARIRGAGLQLLGIYHSHPHGVNEPSRADVARAYYPDAAYFIISPDAHSEKPVRAFAIRMASFRSCRCRSTDRIPRAAARRGTSFPSLRGYLQNHSSDVVMAAAARGKRPHFFEKKIQAFICRLAAALPPNFFEFSRAQILTQRVAHFVQAVGGKQHGVSRRKLHGVDVICGVRKHPRRKTAFTQRTAALADTSKGNGTPAFEK